MLAVLVTLWMWMKGCLSRFFDAPTARLKLPAFADPQALGAYLGNFIYTGDGGPGGGMYDHYTHPEHVNYWIAFNLDKRLYGDKRQWPLHVDCDDISTFAHLGCQGMPGLIKTQMYVFRYPTIRVALADAWRNMTTGRPYFFYFHEACVIQHQGGTYLLDPSGLRPVKDEWDAAVLLGKDFDVIFVPQATPYPFEVA